MNIKLYYYIFKSKLLRLFQKRQSETEILKIRVKVLEGQLDYEKKEVKNLIVARMRELSAPELKSELLNLESCNGWGVSDYRPGVFVRLNEVKNGIEALYLEHKCFPIGTKPEGNFSFCIIEGENGNPVMFEQREVSNLYYKTFKSENMELENIINRVALEMFRTHINRIRVVPA